MPSLHLIKKQAISAQWVEDWVTPLLKNPPERWPYPGRQWYSGIFSPCDLEDVWLVCADSTDKTWLVDHPWRPDVTVGLAKRNWSSHPSGSDYNVMESLISQYQCNCNDASRWIILTEDNWNGQDGIVVDDGNHRAIASVLAGCSSIPVLIALSPTHSSWLI